MPQTLAVVVAADSRAGAKAPVFFWRFKMADDALIEAMARHVAGLNGHSDDWERYLEEAADYLDFCRPIIEAQERKRCARIAEGRYWSSALGTEGIPKAIAAAIRETGDE